MCLFDEMRSHVYVNISTMVDYGKEFVSKKLKQIERGKVDNAGDKITLATIVQTDIL